MNREGEALLAGAVLSDEWIGTLEPDEIREVGAYLTAVRQFHDDANASPESIPALPAVARRRIENLQRVQAYFEQAQLTEKRP